MAVPTLPKLNGLKLTKLQALLLLGGAFVLAAAYWSASRYRLVKDPTGSAPSTSTVVAHFLPQDPDSDPEKGRARLFSALPREARETLASASPNEAVTLFAVPSDDGRLLWTRLDTGRTGKRHAWRLIKKTTGAFGTVVVNGKKRPFEAVLEDERAIFRVGQTYRVIDIRPAAPGTGRRMRSALGQDGLYLEKPEGADWSASADALASELQHFPALARVWALPGRVEFTASASHTDSILQPFILYYRPSGTKKLPHAELEAFARGILADAFPRPIVTRLPDGSQMKETRREPRAVVAVQRENRFGKIEKYAYPGEKTGIYAFYATDGEAWVTTDLSLVQNMLTGVIGIDTPTDACQKGGRGGFASIPKAYSPVISEFSTITFSVQDLETGLLTICGYY